MAPLAARQKLRNLTSEIARGGEKELVVRMRTVLGALGDSPDDLERLARAWEKSLAGAKPLRSKGDLAAKVRRGIAPLVEQLENEQEPRRSEMARWVLEIDSEEPVANGVFGRTRTPDGAWLTNEERAWREGAGRSSNLANGAAGLAIEIESGTSDNAALLAACGEGRFVRAHGLELHASFPPAVLERILLQTLRAVAYSRGQLLDRLDCQGFAPRVFLLVDSAQLYSRVREQARAAQQLSEEDYRRTLDLDLRSFFDKRGWQVSRGLGEADIESVLLWHLLDDWLGSDAQPCLRVGHLSSVCLRFLGVGMPLIAWSDLQADVGNGQRSLGAPDEDRRRKALWRSARTSLWGTRAWMVGEVRANRDPPWARSILDQDGKIQDAHLLKTTLVCDLLQMEGRLWELIEATRESPRTPAGIEEALGESLPTLEGRWRRWLDPLRLEGIVQALKATPSGGAPGDPFAEALWLVNQSRADALQGQGLEIPIVALDPGLSRAAALHARYLTLNPGQKLSWPQAHEEYAGAPGFSVEGALSGSHSIVSFEGDPIRAIRGWLGTFYHRLPLLSPGLFGLGLGTSEEIVVADTGSLVLTPWKDHEARWPTPGALDVPRCFVAEMPNPVPGVDMGGLGYPVTFQLTFVDPSGRVELRMELFRGDVEGGEPVPCYAITPDAPLNPELAPPDAWGLIPKAPLAAGTRYSARARWNDRTVVWSFTTGP